MLDWLYELFGPMLSWFDKITGSYALALLLYALVFKILFLPFSIKQQKNQIKMAELTPKIALIRAKYKGRTDQVTMRKQQEEIMALQQQEGYNPLSGCLPLLIQMPLIIFLYNVIRRPLSYICKISDDAVIALDRLFNPESTTAFKNIDQIELISSIQKSGQTEFVISESETFLVETIPNFNLFGVNLAATPSFTAISILVLIPFIAAATSWLSMVLTRKWNGTGQQMGTDPQAQASMKMMDIMMPLMTLFFAFNFSAMLGIYWVYQSAISILQTFILAKAMPIPKFTEEQLKAMRKAEKEAEKAQRNALKSQPKYKSLHYIDEDDYDELPTVKGQGAAQKPSDSNTPEIKD